MTAPVRTCCRCKTTQDVWYNLVVPEAEPWPNGKAPLCRACLYDQQQEMWYLERLVEWQRW